MTHEVLCDLLPFYPDGIDTFPLGFDNIYSDQWVVSILMYLLEYTTYSELEFCGTQLKCIQDNQSHNFPEQFLTDQSISLYHFVLGCVGVNHLQAALRAFFYSTRLSRCNEVFIISFDYCHKNNNLEQ